eukprot:CAMPEP_0168542566 /NCGR_PEP_ID=MMETSP0413-20121227/1413_1 /TAXON_ID=136452 /ORGANISM="Filamoeba nolandi, Strain NC-AS-23-1" /LENGTH=189 /DNA_ID=CAMNT_0008572445 /DNA_START=42 /DNA_END=608 /DNA_ORIENTATION=-
MNLIYRQKGYQHYKQSIFRSCFQYDILVLDVGCNEGDLSIEVLRLLQHQCSNSSINLLGIDVDSVLIERASSKKSSEDKIEFHTIDMMDNNALSFLKDFLHKHQREKFDLVTCFSITMWIHLNHNDEGLNEFLNRVSSVAHNLIIEPQPWQSYKNAVKRHKKMGVEPHPLFSVINVRNNVEEYIQEYLK